MGGVEIALEESLDSLRIINELGLLLLVHGLLRSPGDSVAEGILEWDDERLNPLLADVLLGQPVDPTDEDLLVGERESIDAGEELDSVQDMSAGAEHHIDGLPVLYSLRGEPQRIFLALEVADLLHIF